MSSEREKQLHDAIRGKVDEFAYVGLGAIEGSVQLDGDFTPEELRVIADALENISVAPPRAQEEE